MCSRNSVLINQFIFIDNFHRLKNSAPSRRGFFVSSREGTLPGGYSILSRARICVTTSFPSPLPPPAWPKSHVRCVTPSGARAQRVGALPARAKW
ncbi:unnamed protein product [Arctia plantaginis]|uniref:Uncharacterized protein n=1 Tax=Arctia plantaginis TaxID=874455 RepID=A0A8S1AU32_ARCPL|nr:unnamed protein product [Arctia plantaginis]